MTKPGEVLTPRSAIVSPSELLKRFIDDHADPGILPAGAVVGGADDDEQNQGVVAIMDAGNTRDELYAPLLWKRCQLRCMAPSLEHADRIGNHLFDLCNDQRNLVLEDSFKRLWFVYGIYCTTGPSHHIDSTEVWEDLLMANITVSRDPVGVP
jgi:hypothetical protein